MPAQNGIGIEELKELIQKTINESALSKVYPVGSIYMSVNNVSPATFLGGTWEALDDGRVLIGANSAHPAGETGGEEKHNLTSSEMPSHKHTVSITSAGSHNHSISGNTNNTGAHTHSRGTMDIEGGFIYDCAAYSDFSDSRGAFNIVKGSNDEWTGSSKNNRASGAVEFKASQEWSGNTSSAGSHSHTLDADCGSAGSHTHSATVGNTGSGGSHNNMQPYLSVYMWKRTA